MAENTENSQKRNFTETEMISEIGQMRQKKRSLNTIGGIMAGFGLIIAILMVFVRDFGSSDGEVSVPLVFIVVGVIIAGIFILSKGSKESKKLAAFVSENLVHAIIAESFGDLEYVYSKRFDEELIRSTGLVGGWNSITGDDYFKGTYKNITVEFSDITLYLSEDVVDSEFPKQTIIFKGPWLICDFGGEVPEKLLAGKETAKKSISELHADIAQTDDKTKPPVQYHFDGGKVHIAVYNRYNFFEVGNLSAAVNNLDALRKKFRNEVKYLTDLIDEFIPNN